MTSASTAGRWPARTYRRCTSASCELILPQFVAAERIVPADVTQNCLGPEPVRERFPMARQRDLRDRVRQPRAPASPTSMASKPAPAGLDQDAEQPPPEPREGWA